MKFIGFIIAVAASALAAEKASAQDWREFKPTTFVRMTANLAELLEDRWDVRTQWKTGRGFILQKGRKYALCEFVGVPDQFSHEFQTVYPDATGVSRCYRLTKPVE